MTNKVTDEIYTKYKSILSYIKINPKATYKEIAEYLGVSRKTIAQKIKYLKDKKIIERYGSTKNGAWIINVDM